MTLQRQPQGFMFDLDGTLILSDRKLGGYTAIPGAAEALRAFGRQEGVTIVSVDGGCPGVQNVADGVIGATSQQYPLKMASMGIEAIAAFAKDGTKPQVSEGLDFTDTGVNLVTDQPVEGVSSISVEEGLAQCWG